MLVCTIISTSIAQTYFSDDFSDGDISDWTQYDADGDNNQWSFVNFSSVISEFDSSIVSYSWYDNTIYTADNYIVSPAIDLTNVTGGITLSYAYGSASPPPFHEETYSVYVTTGNDLATLQGATAIHTETLATSKTRETNILDLSAYAGQTIYVTFRHNCTDRYTIIIDDVVVKTPLSTDALLESVSLNKYSMPSTDNTLSLEISNNGSNDISAIEVNWNDGTDDHISTINVNIPIGATASVDHPIAVNYSTIGQQNITVTITTVNGTNDDNPGNNVQNTIFNTLSQSGTKKVLAEEQTGTWCGYCPVGDVGFDYMTSTYPDTFIGIAVHGGADPMTVFDYSFSLSDLIGDAYPAASIDRTTAPFTPSQTDLENNYNTHINKITPADLELSSTISGSDLAITAEATFYSNFSTANFRLGLIIIENGVTGTDSSYDQINYFANNAHGPMGGYENLPNPVPASQMVYDHVAREIIGGFEGEDNSVPTTITDTQTVQYNFNYTIPSTSSQDNLYMILVLIDNTDGTIVNATQKSINDSLSTSDLELASAISIYPNPTTDKFNIAFDATNANYAITVTDMLGRTVLTQQYNNLSGNNTIEISTEKFSAGQYIVTIATSNASYSKRLIINN